jgi:hypothetical protein
MIIMAKMGFNTRLAHYGVYLGMPGVVLGAYFVFGFLPKYLAAWNVRPKIFLSLFSLLIFIGISKLWFLSNQNYSIKNLTLGQGHDKLFTYKPQLYPTATGIKIALEWIEKNVPRDATLAALPEGVMLNYLTRHTNPTPYTTFILPEWRTFGETNILAAYQKNPPDFIFLIDRDTTEYGGFDYGVGYFGQTPTYGQKTLRWINEHYNPIYLIGQEPLVGKGFGIKILKLKQRVLAQKPS